MENEEIVITVIAGVGLILFLVSIFIVSIIRYRTRVSKETEEKLIMKREFEQVLLQSKLETQEHTFQQIAKELHDNVGQLLSTTKMLLGITERKMEEVPDTLVTAHATLGKAILELRSLSKSLDKEWLEQFNLMDNLHEEISRINAGGNLNVSCKCTGTLTMKSDEQIILFRIIQEALQNTIKHGNATLTNLSIDAIESNIAVNISDNGNGFDATALHTGMGLTNMKYRSMLLGGHIHWQSSVNTGTTVTIQLPIKSELP